MTNKQEWIVNLYRVLSIKLIFTPVAVEIFQYPHSGSYIYYRMIYIFGVRVYNANVSYMFKKD